MRRIPILILLASSAALAVVLSACGGATPTKPLTKSAATGLATTGAMADSLVASMMQPGGFSPFSAGVIKALGGTGVSPQISCSTTTGNTTDADNDGWAVNTTTVFNCTTGGLTYSGSISETDNNDGNPYSGFTATIKDLTISGSGTKLVENLTWDLTQDPTSGVYSLKYDLKIQYTDSSGDFVLEFKGKPTYTPDPSIAATNPFLSGTFTFDGSVSYQDSDGLYQLTRKSGKGGVHYDSACTSTVFTSGSIKYADTNGNTAVISFPACGTVHLTYNGTIVY